MIFFPRLSASSSFVAALLLAAVRLSAQSIPAVPPAQEASPVMLSPFEVMSQRDEGFVASSSLAGGRLAGDLEDTPVAYSVLTAEFIDALNLTGLTEAAQWTVNAYTTPDDGRNEIFGSDIPVSIRGVAANGPQRDFFPNSVNFDSYNLERFDYARGPNAVLFGNGQLGGTANVVAKRAQLGRAIRQLRLTTGSWDDYRATLDLNQPINDKLAVRLNALWSDRDGWRDYEFQKKKSLHVAATYRPFKATELRVEGEWGSRTLSTPINTIQDQLSGWDGVTTFSAPLATVPGDAAARGFARLGGPSQPYLIIAPFLDPGILNVALSARTVGGNNAAATPVGGRLVVGPTANIATRSITEALNLPDDRFRLALANSDFRIPGRHFTVSPDAPSYEQDYKLFSLFVTQQLGEHLFFEAGGNYSRQHQKSSYLTSNGFSNTFIDLNRNLPSGAANPGFLKAFNEGNTFRRLSDNELYNARVGAAYVRDHTRLGDFHFNVMAGALRQQYPIYRYAYVAKRNADPRNWPTSDMLRYRQYWSQPSRALPEISQVTINETGGPRTYGAGYVLNTNPNDVLDTYRNINYVQSAGNAKLFQGRLVLLGSVRWDQFRSSQRIGRQPLDYPTSWDGFTAYQAPPAPADYFAFTYVPKDAQGRPTGAAQTADGRPRDAAGAALPQYAGDRFRDDYSAPNVVINLSTFSAGGVLHLTSWASVLYNVAESFNPGSVDQTIFGGLLPPQQSRGWDAGVRFNLLGGRLHATLSRYEGRERNSGVQTGTVAGFTVPIPTAINALLDANANGDFASGGRNRHGIADVPDIFVDRRNRETRGYELDVVANLTRSWRLLLNAARPEAYQTDAYADTRAYLAQNDTVLRQIAADAGVVINGANVASVNTTIPANQLSPDAAAAAQAWNNLQAIQSNFVSGRQVLTRLTKFTGNVFTDYTFAEGRLRGVKVGAGMNYRGRQVIGYRGADTVRSPTNPAVAIDDPSVDAFTPVYAQSYYTVTAVLGYSFRIGKRYRVGLDFRVANLLDEDQPLYYNTIMRPPGGDLSNPARVNTPSQFSYLVPRSYSLSTSVQF